VLIVDAQIHLWESRTSPPHHRQEPLTADQAILEMDHAGVDRAINCPALWDSRSNEIAVEAAERYPDRFATMGWLQLEPDGDGTRLEHWRKQPGMLGLRFAILQPQHVAWFLNGRLDWIWQAAERYSIPLALAAPGHIGEVCAIAKRYPNLRLLIDHFGAGHVGKVPEAMAHLPKLLSCARFENLAVKATAAPGYATDGYPFRSVHDSLHSVFQAFGARRMFWGTDITRMPCSWRACIDLFTQELPWLAGEDLEQVMGRGICNWIGWR
jgi:predicted TIM-barrel fold metal-dependent hydrolase